MKDLLKLFFILLLLVFILPLIWVVFKEIFFFFGGLLGSVFGEMGGIGETIIGILIILLIIVGILSLLD